MRNNDYESQKLHTSKKLNFKEKVVLLYLLLFSVNYVLKYYLDPNVYKYMTYILAFSFPIVGLWFNDFKISFRNNYERYLIFVYVFMLFNSVLHFASDNAVGGKIETIAIYAIIVSSFLFKNLNSIFFIKAFKFIGITAILLLIFVLLKTDINLSLAIVRGYQWTEIFFYTAPFTFASAFVILSMLHNRNGWTSTVVLSAYVVLNLIIVKRIIFIEVSVLIVMIFLISLLRKRKIITILKWAVPLLSIFLIIYYLIGAEGTELVNSIFERILTETEDVADFNRFVESKNYFNDASIFDIIFGRGFGGSHSGLGDTASALHVGWSNFVLKGGLLFLTLVVIPYFKIPRLLLKFNNLSIEKQFAVIYLIFMFPLLFFINLHNFHPNGFLFYYSCIVVMYKSNMLTQEYKKDNNCQS